jgi:hypothetical protein
MNPDMLRSTITKFKENGIPDSIKKSPVIPILNFNKINQGGGFPGQPAPESSHLIFPSSKGQQSSNLFACENWMEQTLAECHKTHNFIDELFSKANHLEEEGKIDDEYYA